MDASRQLAALALGLAGCTTILGIDGEFDLDGGGGAPTSAASGASTTSDATSVSSSGGGGGDGGASSGSSSSSSSSSSATSGGGAGGGDPASASSSAAASTGAGGSVPFQPGTCARCAAPSTVPTEGAMRPRIAHLSDVGIVSYVTADEVVFLAEEEPSSTSYAAPRAGSAISVVASDFAGAGHYWSEMERLRGDGAIVYDYLERPWIDGARVGDAVYIGAVGLDRKATLLACGPRDGGLDCDPLGVPCGQPAAPDAGRVVDVDSAGGALAFGRICNGRILVSYPLGGGVGTFDEPADDATEIAIASGPASLHVLAIVDGGTDQARVRLFRSGRAPLTVDAPGATSPTMAHVAGEGVVGAFADPDGLVIVSCPDDDEADCSFGRLVSDEGDGAAEPSIGVRLVGPMSDTPEPWIAWQRGGNIHHGPLTSPD